MRPLINDEKEEKEKDNEDDDHKNDDAVLGLKSLTTQSIYSFSNYR